MLTSEVLRFSNRLRVTGLNSNIKFIEILLAMKVNIHTRFNLNIYIYLLFLVFNQSITYFRAEARDGINRTALR